MKWRKQSFQTTYEELKLSSDSISTSFISASRLPMRNWNSWIGSLGGVSISSASRLPMRNWNTNFNSPFTINQRLPDYLWGIETSTHINPSFYAIGLPDYLWGIETPEREDRCGSRRRLPDYLWGIETYHHIRHLQGQNMLPDYLWGIETIGGVAADEWYLASRLPMRNWNSTDTYIKARFWGFQTTYEELKPG